MTFKDYSTNKLKRYDNAGINDPPEVDGRQIADDAMRNATWTRVETGGPATSDADSGWLYQGDGATESISVAEDVPVQLNGGWEDEVK